MCPINDSRGSREAITNTFKLGRDGVEHQHDHRFFDKEENGAGRVAHENMITRQRREGYLFKYRRFFLRDDCIGNCMDCFTRFLFMLVRDFDRS